MDTISNNCVYCGAAAASHCARCEATKYCGPQCQKSDWSIHKTTCGKQGLDLVVHRAAEMLQDIYYFLREKTFDNAILSIEHVGDTLVIRDKPMVPGTIYPFPHHLVHSEEETKMVLTTLICQEPIAYLYDLFLEMLKGTGVALEELNVKIKKPIKRARVVAIERNLDMDQFYHSVVRVKSSDGDISWIVDVSGAQYSIFKACWDEKAYAKQHVVEFASRIKSGTNHAIYKKVATMKGNLPLITRIAWGAVDKIYAAIQKWKTTSRLSLPALMRATDAVFRQGKEQLMVGIGEALDKFVAEADFKVDINRTRFYESRNPLAARQEVTKVFEEIPRQNLL
ncbi:hypothetical protein N0V90_002939 [Kalmusia sp. IMI 367209]|nr:hypothetical protein N0V90_002939 [Kalmusia sp. IMI 367209]